MILIDNKLNDKILRPTYVALGSFDGIHIGHLTLINKAIELAKEHHGLSMVYTFKNHPLNLIDKSRVPKLLMDNENKIECFEKIGVDLLCLNDFTEEIMKMNPKDFIVYLVEEFNVKGIIVGFNYRFGYRNKGDIALLKELSDKLDYKLVVKEALLYEGEVVSSTRIREALENGQVEEVAKMLAKPYMLSGTVVDGKKIGRTIGFPTANLEINESMIIPKIGVYYTNVEINEKKYKSITSVGNNPTVNGQNITVETYILNFNEDIYGEKIKLFFIKRMRNEEKFNSLEELKRQLNKDKDFARYQNIKINL